MSKSRDVDPTAADTIQISDDMIRLGQLLKLANLAEDGTQAKELVDHGLVKVNGAIEERRGAQLHPGDVVTVNGVSVTITRA
ncbi:MULTISPECIES: RNA-binding S4 domain-containing protein [unclassified Arthrobacter]|uniref:RNA-binding S4 domain-containing protein n=1 Tax=unclassified Arthrobacter TaxID=235627 RepID=UPI001490C220|nr:MULTISPECIES: RNA-binding S4 domain-containing protein [unclassified Arthrobacter]MBE0009334.1 RNA-binding S4 domain-containing protein [Arthrobacter sp. AET 35A]NOJ60649.1 RNA-binding S4 domain-containing protein [Arthrobacter sp. 260]NOJ63169.1 RNA-binding S4 domain-containing protein [Arthrobacter sp. 147(2020)]